MESYKMLSQINISNFAIISNLDLSLPTGMTAITGETGAGKSIVIDALDVALGDRADPKLIRAGTNRCEINVVFDVKHIPLAKEWLQEHMIDTDENECIIRRLILREGRSRAFINGSAVTLQQLRDLALLLVQIHGQHQHHALIRKDEQRLIIDRFLQNPSLCATVKKAFQAWQQVKKRIHDLQQGNGDQAAERNLLEYQLKELSDLNLAEGEWEQLNEEQKQLAHAEQLLLQLQCSLNCLSDNPDVSAVQLLTQAQTALQSVQNFHQSITGCNECLANALIQVDEVINEIQSLSSSISVDPERLQQADQRLKQLYDISRKYQVAPEALLELQQTMEEKLDDLIQQHQDIDSLKAQEDTLKQHYLDVANKLSQRRQKTASQLAKKITKSMQMLGMPEGKFHIAVEANNENPQIHGIDQIEFQTTTNPGQPLASLAKVASGGELSRISLAIQVITAQRDNTPTLIFDEVDVGIGGATAEIVGKLLRQLGETTQILCITHLGQVAAQGQQHVKIEKYKNGKQTMSTLTLLSTKQRIEEIARMVGGVKITQQTLAHAKELLATKEHIE